MEALALEPVVELFAGDEDESEELAAGVEVVVEGEDPLPPVSEDELEERLSVL